MLRIAGFTLALKQPPQPALLAEDFLLKARQKGLADTLLRLLWLACSSESSRGTVLQAANTPSLSTADIFIKIVIVFTMLRCATSNCG